MNRWGQGVVAGGAALALLASVAASTGCGQFKALFAWKPAADSAAPAAIRPASGSADSHYRLGRHYAERRRHHEAAAEFRKAIDADAGHAKAWNGLGVCLDALGRFDDASRAYAEALRLDPTLDYVHNNLGYSQVLRGNHEDGAAELAKAIELNPANQVARRNLELASAVGAGAGPAGPAASDPAATAPSAVAPATSAPAARPALPAQPAATPGVSSPAITAFAPATPPSSQATASTLFGARPVTVSVTVADAAPTTTPAPAAAPNGTVLVPVAADPARPDSVRMRVVSAQQLRKETRVEVSNASAQPKLLDEVSAFLAAQGYRVETGRPTAKQKRDKTLIHYRDGALQPAYQVSKTIPGYQDLKKAENFASAETTVRVTIGRDLEGRRKDFAIPVVAAR